MRPYSHDVDAADLLALRDKALNLRESVNSSRARMRTQTEGLERLRRDIAELRALAAGAPSRRKTVRSAPIPEETAAVSASVAVSSRTSARSGSWKPVPYIAIFFVAVGMQMRTSARRVEPPVQPAAVAAPAVPEAAVEDDGTAEALLLAHDWRVPGDERSLSERLGSGMNPPGSQPDWTAERTGERTYRVSFKPGSSDAEYEFNVDLDARRVDPTPETAELIAPRLVSRR